MQTDPPLFRNGEEDGVGEIVSVILLSVCRLLLLSEVSLNNCFAMSQQLFDKPKRIKSELGSLVVVDEETGNSSLCVYKIKIIQ